jgi:cysteate synthase
MEHQQTAADAKLTVHCARCGALLDPLAHACPACPEALPRSRYRETGFHPLERDDIFRFSDWLPPTSMIDTSIGPTVYRSERLAERLGLHELWIAFNGYAPEIGARNMTGSFKDFEALPTLLYLREAGIDSVMLASAGNTARAFAYAATLLEFPTYIVVPERMTKSVWLPVRPSEAVRLVVLEESGDYSAAIRFAAELAGRFGIHPEGGARNIARRDGMATAMLEFGRVAGRLPVHYVQAIGSGTGAIAAWEASQRLMQAGFAGPLPKLHLVQNLPFAPIHDAWMARSPRVPEGDLREDARRIEQLLAPVLANRRPPYHLTGGVRDALEGTGGGTYGVTNPEIEAAQQLFATLEGVPIGPEGGAALSAVMEGIRTASIRAHESVLLHITGNGEALLQRDYVLQPLAPWLRVPPDSSPEDLEARFCD